MELLTVGFCFLFLKFCFLCYCFTHFIFWLCGPWVLSWFVSISVKKPILDIRFQFDNLTSPFLYLECKSVELNTFNKTSVIKELLNILLDRCVESKSIDHFLIEISFTTYVTINSYTNFLKFLFHSLCLHMLILCP